MNAGTLNIDDPVPRAFFTLDFGRVPVHCARYENRLLDHHYRLHHYPLTPRLRRGFPLIFSCIIEPRCKREAARAHGVPYAGLYA